jgi:hypothetical protein
LIEALAGVKLNIDAGREFGRRSRRDMTRGQSGKSYRCENPRPKLAPRSEWRRPDVSKVSIKRLAACRGGLMAVNLEGVRLRRLPGPSGLKRLMNRSLAHQGLVSYEVVTPPNDPVIEEKPREKRASARRRLRLRSAKLLDSQGAFICECLVRDQSAQGLCLQLMKNIGLPTRCIIYDDETGALNVVTTMWRRGPLIGVRYCQTAAPVSIKPSDRSALRGRYYAVAD